MIPAHARAAGAAPFLAALVVGAGPAQGAEAEIFLDRSAWEHRFSAFAEDQFTGNTLNPFVRAFTVHGQLRASKFLDRIGPGEGTLWEFGGMLHGFGADWDLAGVGGPGTGLSVFIGVTRGDTLIGEISRFSAGGFWGFTSLEGFNAVFIMPGTQAPGVESYTMDNMVWSTGKTVPLPSVVELGLIGFAGLLFVRGRRR